MIFAAIELKTKCPKCGNPIMLNGPVRKAHCSYCQHDLSIHPMIWKSILGDLPEEIKNLKPGEGNQSSTLMAELNREMKILRKNPVCPSCDTPLQNIPEKLKTEEDIPCRKCGKNSRVAPSPKWLNKAVPEIAVLINSAGESDSGDELQATGGKPVLFFCPACKGSLKVDGSDRMVVCEFCDSSIYLPDDLWYRLHPIKTVTQWYVGIAQGGLSVKQAKLNSNLLEAAYEGESEDGLDWLKKGADPRCIGDSGRSVLFYAAATGADALVLQLLKAGAEPDLADDYGTTPLNIASFNGYGQCVDHLLEYPVDINKQNKVGVTALYGAAKMGHFDIVKKLIKLGADPHLANEDGDTPYAKAQEFGHRQIADFLKSRM